MHGKVKLTKREIKEDKFATFMLTAKDQLTENWQYVAIGAAILVLVVAAVIFYMSSQSTAKVEAAQKLATAQMDYRSGNTQVAIMSLNQIVEDFSGATAEQALFLLGKVSYESKNYPEAIRYYEQYISKYGSNEFQKAAALGGIAASHENQGEFAEAAAKYLEASAAFTGGPSDGEYLFGAMRCYLQVGDRDKAKTALTDLKSRFAGTSLESRASRYYAEKDPTSGGA
jgi:TolA-binding protein